MGYLFEYCDKYFKELYNKDFKLDKLKFIEAFMKSDCRALMEVGHPTLLSQAAIDTLEDFITVDCNNYEQFKHSKNTKQHRFNKMQLYWIGWIYAYIHFRSQKPSRFIIDKLHLNEMLIDYKCGHEISKENYYSKISYLFN